MGRLSEFLKSADPNKIASPVFLWLSFFAHKDVALANLAKLFDRHRNALSYWKLLNFCEQNAEWLAPAPASAPKFIQGLRDAIEQHATKLDALKRHRDKRLFHLDWDQFVAEAGQDPAHDLTWGDVRELYELAGALWNKLSSEFDKATTAWELRGPPLNDETDVAVLLNYARRHYDISHAVKKRGKLSMLLPAVKNLEEKNRVGHEIRASNAEIDRRVYELYGLTEEKIKIVEGAGNV
jgi:hypothetical protein